MIFDVLTSALAGMVRGPMPLARALEFFWQQLQSQGSSGSPAAEVLTALATAGAGDEALGVLRRRLAGWDNEDADWTRGTQRNTEERRRLIYELLSLDQDWINFCQDRLPYQPLARPTVIASEHRRWYSPEIRTGRDFYWSRYTQQLRKQGWPEVSLLQLDESTTSIVERLADPTDELAFQSKGLVIGYVQSGKTANFTGVIAKAADAGYKLIVVLAGMLDVLRSQTQRRIDKELIGQELLGREYWNDPDWGDFLSHGAKPSELGAFDWSRLTGPEEDYQRLRYAAVDGLKFDLTNSTLPFFHRDNLVHASTRIAVIKKHSRVIQKLLTDLNTLARQRIGAPIEQVPTLIIDDESDQASINVRKPAEPGEEQERTATNKAIVDLLKLLPRAQYVGYTATPFANVLIDPASEGDIFPKDFLISLPRPAGYMGVANFYDLDAGAEEEGPNKRDYVRPVVGDDEQPDNLERAIDSFVLTGAIKLWRAQQDASLKFRHHTMLIHASQLRQEHKKLAGLVAKIYAATGYDGGRGLDRLARLFEEDFAPVAARRRTDIPFPDSFEMLGEQLGECLGRIGESGDAVLIVNTDKQTDTPDFDQRSVWKMLVGGAKLSRGYTVEGLTVSYYRRRAASADTLMQMGRWFGFRRGYHDLVRLFIGTDEKIGRGSDRINLYEAFGAVCRDEEFFREELKRYASIEDPRITPGQIPPLVPQHMLRPTAPNKMRNAVVTSRNFGGLLSESTFAPRDTDQIEHNNAKFAHLMHGRSIDPLEATARVDDREKRLSAWTTIFSTGDLIKFIREYRWFDPKTKDASSANPMHLQLEFLEGRAGNHGITDWLMLAPRYGAPRAEISIEGRQFDVVYRSRDEERETRFHTYNDPVHRQFAGHICGQLLLDNPSASLSALRSSTRGVMLYYTVTDEKKTKSAKAAKPPFTTAFTLLFPNNNIRSAIRFSVRSPGQADEAIVTVED